MWARSSVPDAEADGSTGGDDDNRLDRFFARKGCARRIVLLMQLYGKELLTNGAAIATRDSNYDTAERAAGFSRDGRVPSPSKGPAFPACLLRHEGRTRLHFLPACRKTEGR